VINCQICPFMGFGNLCRQSRKPLINQRSVFDVVHIAHYLLLICIGNDRGNRHTQYARVVIIGKIGQTAIRKSEVT